MGTGFVYSLKVFVDLAVCLSCSVFDIEGKQKCSSPTLFGFCPIVRGTDADGGTKALSRFGKGLWKVALFQQCYGKLDSGCSSPMSMSHIKL